MFYLAIVVAALCIIYLVSKLWPALIKSAPWDPTPMRIVREMLDMAELKKGEKLYDLGCGDGRIIVTAARQYGAYAVGVELDPIRYAITKLRTRRLKNAEVRRENFFSTDLSDADVVTLFLYQSVNNRLREKLFSELKDGARVVTYIWTFDRWEAEKADRKNRVYLYRVSKKLNNEKDIDKSL
jgi:SAM-dependent methyltransferase